jgi:chitinase
MLKQLSDEWADTQIEVDGVNGCLASFAALKREPRYSHIKLILSVGGAGKGSENFASVAHDPAKSNTFAISARQLLDAHGLDGIDSTATLTDFRMYLRSTNF